MGTSLDKLLVDCVKLTVTEGIEIESTVVAGASEDIEIKLSIVVAAGVVVSFSNIVVIDMLVIVESASLLGKASVLSRVVTSMNPVDCELLSLDSMPSVPSVMFIN